MLSVKARYLLDEYIAITDEYNSHLCQHKRRYPHGIYVSDSTEYCKIYHYKCYDKAEAIINTLRWMFPEYDLNAAARVYRNWHIRTGWQRIMPESDIERIMNCFKNGTRWYL